VIVQMRIPTWAISIFIYIYTMTERRALVLRSTTEGARRVAVSSRVGPAATLSLYMEDLREDWPQYEETSDHTPKILVVSHG
jgi:hypothetical protein